MICNLQTPYYSVPTVISTAIPWVRSTEDVPCRTRTCSRPWPYLVPSTFRDPIKSDDDWTRLLIPIHSYSSGSPKTPGETHTAPRALKQVTIPTNTASQPPRLEPYPLGIHATPLRARCCGWTSEKVDLHMLRGWNYY